MPNDMRDRLIEIIRNSFLVGGYDCDDLADHLIANGVILPPCKVGDMVYTVGKFTGQIIPNKVASICCSKTNVFLFMENGTFVDVSIQLGKTVFLTQEEAEAKLKEIVENG